MRNIAVLVSGGGTNLQAIIDKKNSGGIANGNLSVVISGKSDAYALTRAKNAGIATEVVCRKDHAELADFDRALLCVLKKYDIDLVILAGFMTILGAEVVDAYPNAIINVHPALLPSFGGKGYYGLRVHDAVLKAGVKLTGATVHFVSPECDAGPIILQKAVDVLEGDTPEILQKRVMEQAEWELLPKAAELFCDGRLTVEGRIVHIS